MAFLSDIRVHLNAFAAARNVSSNQVRVRLTLADGSSVTTRGLQTDDPQSPGGWGMIRALAPDSPVQAFAVRETHIIKVEFLASSDHMPIGFHSEAAP